MFILTYFQIERTSTNLRYDGLLNHISSIFLGQPVQGEPVREAGAVGGVVEVAAEVRHNDPQISVPAVQAQVEVLSQAQQVAGLLGGPVAGPQPVRGVSQDAARVAQVKPHAQGSAFQRFLVSKPRPGFAVSSAPSNWFSPSYHHKRVSVPSSTPSSASTSVVSEPSLPTSVPGVVPASTLSSDGILGFKGEKLTVTDLKTRSKEIISSFVHNSLSEGTQRIYKLNYKLLKNFGLDVRRDENKVESLEVF